MRPIPKGDLFEVFTIRANEILHYLWDPIGVSGVPQARDEYDSYVPMIVEMVFEDKGSESIATHLRDIESARMGLNVTEKSKERATEVAESLVEHYKWLKNSIAVKLTGSMARQNKRPVILHD